jgi:signal transduction histidine kinase
VTGTILLAIGLMLTAAAVVAARVPGGATFARPGIAVSPVRAFLLAPIHPTTWYANGAIGIGLFSGVIAFATIVSLVSAGLTVLLVGVGFVLIVLAIEASRLFAAFERRRVYLGEPTRPAPHPYRPLRGSIVDLLRAEFADESRWRDVLYVAINLPLTVIEFMVVVAVWALAFALLTLPFWIERIGSSVAIGLSSLGFVAPLGGVALLFVAASLSQIVISLHRALVAGLLCTSESRELRRQVETLRQSRSAVIDVEASELHRIERDLHDGAQRRLVMLSIDLGLASERIDSDPAAAKELILEGQEQARQALAEIRDLVRGIAPSILLDRGLVAALESISARGPVPTVIRSELAPGERFAPAVERAAYFVAAEALANVAKHSGARGCEVRIRREGGRLVVEVQDDGAGGARIEPTGGLAGLAGRVAGVDGAFTVSSPDGGPTVVRAEIPVPAGSAVSEGESEVAAAPPPAAVERPAQEPR